MLDVLFAKQKTQSEPAVVVYSRSASYGVGQDGKWYEKKTFFDKKLLWQAPAMLGR